MLWPAGDAIAMNAPVPEISIVVPMFRESGHVFAVAQAIQSFVGQCADSYEIILVDDGSPDDTWAHMDRSAREVPGVRAMRLSRNFGKEYAVAAGLERARGRCAIVMDGDLQHPPALIPKMIQIWRDGGADVVEAVKTSRGDEGTLSAALANGFYSLLRKLSGFDLQNASDFKLLDRKVVAAWMRLRERNLFFRGMTAWLGFRRTQVDFQVPPRVGGNSRWSLYALARLAVTAITAFSSSLLQLVTLMGLVFLAFALLLGLYTMIIWWSGRAETGFTTVIVLLLIIGGVLMMSLGIIGLYLGRIYDEIKARPRYLVSETIGFCGTDEEPGAADESAVSLAERLQR
jgi:polyisoprenyl-phosphate glycosyltransferase